jgi:hypothetical protein
MIKLLKMIKKSISIFFQKINEKILWVEKKLKLI